jgi:hypothetical protein
MDLFAEQLIGPMLAGLGLNPEQEQSNGPHGHHK